MAKKTNKTNHVLNLLSGGSEKLDLPDQNSQGKPPVDPNQPAVVSIVHASSANDSTADTIKRSLEAELEESMAGTAKKMTPDSKPVPESVKAADSKREIAAETLQAADEKPEQSEKSVLTAEEEPKQTEKSVPTADEKPEKSVPTAEQPTEIAEKPVETGEQKAEKAEESEPVAVQKANTAQEPVPAAKDYIQSAEETVPAFKTEAEHHIETMLEAESETIEATVPPLNEPKVVEPEIPYILVNVMERLVREKVMMYMKQFGNCTCHRCVEDTTALALTHLTAKYEVVNREAVSPLLNFYSSKYAGDITVEITKACIRVNAAPHHSRE